MPVNLSEGKEKKKVPKLACKPYNSTITNKETKSWRDCLVMKKDHNLESSWILSWNFHLDNYLFEEIF